MKPTHPPHRAPRDSRGDPGLFAKLRVLSVSRLRAVLVSVIAKSDDALYELTQKEEVAYGSLNLVALKTLRQCSGLLEQTYVQHLESAFSTLQRCFEEDGLTEEELHLVEIEAMEDMVAAELIVEAIVRAHGPSIDIAERRLAHLVGVEHVPANANPISPTSISNAMRLALNDLILTPDVRLLLFKNYQRELIAQLGPIFGEINALFMAGNILPELSVPSTNYGSPGGHGGARRQAAKAVLSQLVNAVGQEHSGHSGYAESPAMTGGGEDKDLFEALRNMLQNVRPQQAQAMLEAGKNYPQSGNQDSGRRPLAMDEMMSVLSLLQPSVPSAVTQAMAHSETSLAVLLKQEMLDSANRIGLTSDQVKMGRDEEDAVDLVGMLFDVLFDERDFEMQSRTLISRLVVPYVKAAVIDRRLFQYKTHPARRLLNSLSEALEGNKGEGQQERELLQKAESTVDRLVTEFNEDIAIFEILEQELRSFLEQHHRRNDLAERRATEAQRGQERLEQARSLATTELDRRVQSRAVPTVLSDFLARIWSHHLSMIALREGPESPAWSAALGVADCLVELLPQPGSEPADLDATLAQLREPLENVLASSGITGEAAQEVMRSLSTGFEIANLQGVVLPEEPAIQPVIAAVAKPALSVVSDKDRFDYDPDDLTALNDLKVGSWIDVAGGTDDKLHPAKLSWVSPISSRLMFVNRRGVRVLVASVEELAAMKKAGKLVIREQEQVFDQAMHRVMDRLQQHVA